MSQYQIRCSEIWGGTQEVDLEVETSSVRASVYSKASSGAHGGDIHYFSVCGSDMLTRVALADVQGHGEEVSQISGWLYDLVRDSMDSVNATQVLTALNERVLQKGHEAASTAVILSYYLGDRKLHVSYAGHPPALLQRKDQDEWAPITLDSGPGLTNLPLGLFSNVRYNERTLALEAGDRLVIHTDGLTDYPDLSGEPVGSPWLLTQLNGMRGHGIGELKKAVLQVLQAQNPSGQSDDDVTLLTIEVI